MNLDDVFFSYIIRCGIEPTEISLVIAFQIIDPHIPKNGKNSKFHQRKRLKSKRTMPKYCWRGFIWAVTLLVLIFGVALHGLALFPNLITSWNVFSPILNCDVTFLSLVCNLEEYFFTSVLGHQSTILPILPHLHYTNVCIKFLSIFFLAQNSTKPQRVNTNVISLCS